MILGFQIFHKAMKQVHIYPILLYLVFFQSYDNPKLIRNI